MHVFSVFTYIIIVYCQTHFYLLFSIIMNCVTCSLLCATRFVLSLIDLVNVYENQTCWIKQPGKDMRNGQSGRGKLEDAHRNVLESHGNHFDCSVCLCSVCSALSHHCRAYEELCY